MSALPSSGDHISLQDLEPLLKKLVDQHHRQFANALSLSISWQDDNTNASGDVSNFQAILRLFGYPTAEEYVIPDNACMPGWDIAVKIQGLIRQAMKMTGRTIILIHYAGHGLNHNERLFFCDSTEKKKFNVDRNLLNFVDSESNLTDSDNIDIVFIFDCCYSYLATRGYRGENRVVEVLAAVDAESKLAFSAGVRASFTGKLYAEILRRKQLGAKDVELADLIMYLRKESPVKKPAYRILVGVNSLRLLAETLTIGQLAAFCDWIWKLPREIGLSLELVFETQSMLMIFLAPFAFWLKLKDYRFVEFIGESDTGNLLLSIPTSSTPGPKEENIHPNPSHTASKPGYHSGRHCSY
ncbi:hypothetical protein BDV40DRAFT_290207 [Aspergillus tamarii]|uniref:Caspase domain-containing protein n=1 Tax=Aspergillus tamarii TaxID=41984 RepID=A0A5N6UPB8_ASPTM|nr:hypothetical protein BDV40DRAFT_290207 [Aspergillus tamarii]